MIKYKKGYKYQLCETYFVSVPIFVRGQIDTKYITLTVAGLLTIKNGYAWDGASGPTIDGPTNMRASLVHDALYQLMRLGLLDRKKFKATTDDIFRDMCLEDGMIPLRAKYYYYSLVKFGGRSTTEGQLKRMLTAPEAFQ